VKTTVEKEDPVELTKDSDYGSSQEKMLELFTTVQDTGKEDWAEKDLPKLVDDILDSYEASDIINHL